MILTGILFVFGIVVFLITRLFGLVQVILVPQEFFDFIVFAVQEVYKFSGYVNVYSLLKWVGYVLVVVQALVMWVVIRWLLGFLPFVGNVRRIFGIGHMQELPVESVRHDYTGGGFLKGRSVTKSVRYIKR